MIFQPKDSLLYLAMETRSPKKAEDKTAEMVYALRGPWRSGKGER